MGVVVDAITLLLLLLPLTPPPRTQHFAEREFMPARFIRVARYSPGQCGRKPANSERATMNASDLKTKKERAALCPRPCPSEGQSPRWGLRGRCQGGSAAFFLAKSVLRLGELGVPERTRVFFFFLSTISGGELLTSAFTFRPPRLRRHSKTNPRSFSTTLSLSPLSSTPGATKKSLRVPLSEVAKEKTKKKLRIEAPSKR